MQFDCGLLPGISVSFLEDAYGPFLAAIDDEKSILLALYPPFPKSFVELEPFNIIFHFLSPA
jgi:hypothetical protein